MVVTIKVERGRKSASPPQILGSERGWKGDVDMLSRIDVMSTSRVSLNGEGDTYLSILGIIAIVKVRGVGNKVECGVVFEEGTCIQQRARMLCEGLVKLNQRGTREKRDLPARTS